MFFVCKSLRITSKTVVLRIDVSFWSSDNGVYPVIKKWHLGVGTKLAISPTMSLFMYPGYLSVVVEAAITVETIELICEKVGCKIFSLSTAILVKALLSRTTTQSALSVNLLILKRQL